MLSGVALVSHMLNHVIVGDPSNPIVAVLHGIFGAGNNWRSFIQKWIHVRPDVCFVLVDLRNHGYSSHFDIDNTLMQCAIEVLELQSEVGNFSAIVGHSFGGKVALQCAAVPMFSEIEQIWALDSFPGFSAQMIKTKTKCVPYSWLNAVPLPVAKRSEVKYFLMEQGASEMIAQWMTTNLTRTAAGFVWRFHLDGIAEMLNDYFVQDLWHVLEFPNSQTSTHLVRALKSDRWDDEAIETLEDLGEGQYHTLDAGHWLYDNPDGLLSMLGEWVLPR